MAGRGDDRARGGGRDGDGDSSSEDDLPPAKLLSPEEKWALNNMNSKANANWCRNQEEKRLAAEKKYEVVKDFLLKKGVSESEFNQRFMVPRRQGTVRDRLNGNALVICEEVAAKRVEYLHKKFSPETPETKGEMMAILLRLESLEMTFQKLCKHVKKLEGEPVQWPDHFKTKVCDLRFGKQK